jgi:hypothetical protein
MCPTGTVKRLVAGAGRARVTGAVALAALVLVSGLAAARAQTGGVGAGKVSMNDLFAASVGLAQGQTLRVSVFNPALARGGGRIVGGHVRVFDGATGALRREHVLDDPPAGLHSFDVGARDLLIGGDGADTGAARAQLWVEVKLVSRSERVGTPAEQGAGLFPPNFELIDDASGRTTAHGTLAKTGPGTLVLSGQNTY